MYLRRLALNRIPPDPATLRKFSIRFAQVWAVSVAFPGIRPILFENLQVTVKQTVFPFEDSGRPMMKSMQIIRSGVSPMRTGLTDPYGG